MSNDLSASPVGVSHNRVFRSEAEWRSLVADFASWDGTQRSFCADRGVSEKTFGKWRRRLGEVASNGVGTADGFVELSVSSEPVWDVELSLGDGVVLRVRRS